MASSENVATIDTCMLRPPVTDSWLTEFFTRDADTLTKALHKSFSQDNNLSPFKLKPDAAAAATPTVSSLSCSDQESLPRRCPAPPPSGKITKRKSRPSKGSQTTFIAADAANFRQMVQQITGGGVRFGGVGVPIAPVVLKPEPQSGTGLIGASFPVGAGCLPTLDTSAFLLDHHQQQGGAGPGTGLSGPAGPPLTALDALAASFPSAGLDFDTFSSFPTLESWKVM